MIGLGREAGQVRLYEILPVPRPDERCACRLARVEAAQAARFLLTRQRHPRSLYHHSQA